MAWKIPEKYRIESEQFGLKGEPFGAFQIESPDKSRVTKTNLVIIATPGDESVGIDWEHVSVRAEKTINSRIVQMLPTWTEMCFVKALFWDDEDVVMQLHPKKSEYVNNHNFVLHLWKPTKSEIPTPPSILVGFKNLGDLSQTN